MPGGSSSLPPAPLWLRIVEIILFGVLVFAGGWMLQSLADAPTVARPVGLYEIRTASGSWRTDAFAVTPLGLGFVDILGRRVLVHGEFVVVERQSRPVPPRSGIAAGP